VRELRANGALVPGADLDALLGPSRHPCPSVRIAHDILPDGLVFLHVDGPLPWDVAADVLGLHWKER
jgi:hypothetical protein